MDWFEEKEKLGKEIVEALYDVGMIDTWYRSRPEGWTLISGLWSPIYVNFRPIGSHPELLKKIGYALSRLIEEECKEVSCLVGIASAGVPIATSLSLSANIPMCYTRKIEGVKNIDDFSKRISEYGQHNLVEGIINDGENIALIDDLVTKLDSKLIAKEQVMIEIKKRNIQANCNIIIVILDREQGATQLAEENGLSLHSLIPFQSKAISWLKDKLSEVEYNTISDYLINFDKYQNKEIQTTLKQECLKN